MSVYFSKKFASLTPYTPGEQPQNRKYIKLNTNESPFPPSEKAISNAAEEAEKLQLYSDPQCRSLVRKLAETFHVSENEVLPSNGSDEILNFSFMAFCDDEHPAVFPDITYGFYPVFAQLNHIPYETIPLREDFSICADDFCGIGKTIFIANPNAPTGLTLSIEEIRRILDSNRENVVLIDEAYVDFGAESCVNLIHEYSNLLVVQTFSKSRSMAGARLGFGIGCEELINDLNTIKYSTNPYNVNRMTMAAGVGALEDEEYMKANCESIIRTRDFTIRELNRLGFVCTDSKANFVFAKHPRNDGKEIYEKLKERGILIRHFDLPRIAQYNRITVGTLEQMQTLITTLEEIL